MACVFSTDSEQPQLFAWHRRGRWQGISPPSELRWRLQCRPLVDLSRTRLDELDCSDALLGHSLRIFLRSCAKYVFLLFLKRGPDGIGSFSDSLLCYEFPSHC